MRILELLGSSLSPSSSLFTFDIEKELFEEGRASKALRQLQVLRDVHQALKVPLDTAICITAARRIHTACSHAKLGGLHDMRSKT